MKVDEIDEDEFNEILAQKRHKEMIQSLSSLSLAISSIKPNDDKNLVEAIKSQPIVFKNVIDEVVKSFPKEISKPNVTDEYKKILSLFEILMNQAVEKIEISNKAVVESIENRLLPDSFDLVRTLNGITESVKVNYKKSNKIII